MLKDFLCHCSGGAYWPGPGDLLASAVADLERRVYAVRAGAKAARATFDGPARGMLYAYAPGGGFESCFGLGIRGAVDKKPSARAPTACGGEIHRIGTSYAPGGGC